MGKELIGLYVSDHPLSRYIPLMRQKVTHFSKDLAEVAHKQRVIVAGMVTHIRTTMTKKSNKQMAFATIEDLQGALELVIFPKTWEKFGALVRMETVIVVEGQVDAEGSEPKVLADIIQPLGEEDLNNFQQPNPHNDGDPTSESWQSDIDTARYAQYEDGYEEPPPSEEEVSWKHAAFRSIAEVASAPLSEGRAEKIAQIQLRRNHPPRKHNRMKRKMKPRQLMDSFSRRSSWRQSRHCCNLVITPD